jgi:hypothetical protein
MFLSTGLFRTVRPTADAQILLSALEARTNSLLHSGASPGRGGGSQAAAAASTAAAGAWVTRRLAEEGRDPHLVAATFSLLLKSHPPLIPARAWGNVLSFELSASSGLSSPGLNLEGVGSYTKSPVMAHERAVAGAREALTPLSLVEWRLLGKVCNFLARLAFLSTASSSSPSSPSSPRRMQGGCGGGVGRGGGGGGSDCGGGGSAAGVAALVHAVGPVLGRPEGSAFMGVNHLAGLSPLR